MLRHILWGAILGPPAGMATLVAGALTEKFVFPREPSVGAVPGWHDLPSILVFVVVVTYAAGIWPSIAFGVANGLLFRFVQNAALRWLLVAVTGAGAGLATVMASGRGALPPLHEAAIWMLAGAVASLVAAVVASRLRRER